MSTPTKQRIANLFATNYFTEATSYDIYEFFSDTDEPVSNDTVDRNLKEMVESGTLVREKKANSSGRQVYHYSKPSTKVTAVDNDAEIEPEEAPAEVETPPTGPQITFIVRKDDIYGFSFGSGGMAFARTVAPFDRSGRRFAKFGNAVISIMYSDTSAENIVGALENANLGITYEVVNSLEDAIEALRLYTPGISEYTIQTFKNFAENYVRYSAPRPVTTAPAAQAPANKTPMQKFADRDFHAITNQELLDVIAVLAQKHLESNS